MKLYLRWDENVHFEWDPQKAEVNLRKHDVSFPKAIRVFSDPARQEFPDFSEDYGEDRWITIGSVDQILLTVVFTQRQQRTRLIFARRALAMSNDSTGTVFYRYDPSNPPKLTAEEEAAWERVKTMRDEDIDLSDTPDQSHRTGWRRASQPVMDLVSEENKQQITLRLDAEVLSFFKGTGKRYQSRINAVLREYMLAHRTAVKP